MVPFFIAAFGSLLPSGLIPGNHKCVLQFCNFITLRMLYKWNHRAYNFLGLSCLFVCFHSA